MVSARVRVVYPKDDHQVLLFTDASDGFWVAVITQIPLTDVSKPFTEQRHKPLLFISGRFTGAQERWAIPDKEGYAIVAALRKAAYLLQQPRGTLICTDHRNLAYIFAPDAGMNKPQLYRLHRWALELSQYKYSIVHLAGAENTWVDLLSRWHQSSTTLPVVWVCRIQAPQQITTLPLDEWPSIEELRAAQTTLSEEDGEGAAMDSEGLLRKEGAVIVPRDHAALLMRLLVIAHAGLAGHRGEQATLSRLNGNFIWQGMQGDVKDFVKACTLCIADGPNRIPRPLGCTIKGTAPSQVVHFDFLKIDSSTENEYLVVLKDGFSQYVKLYATPSADAMAAATSLLDWVSSYGTPQILVSDQGTHFKNRLVAELTRILGIKHKFVHAYMPWANGSIERMNREVLKLLRKLVCEARARLEEWESFVPLVQAALNHAPRERLANHAPVTVFLQLPADNPLEVLLRNGRIQQLGGSIESHMAATTEALDQMHREVSEASATQAPPTGTPINFTKGDFVLVAFPIARKKLQMRWSGPFRVTKILSHQIAEVEHLITAERLETHTSRMKFYADASLEVTEELLQHVETTSYQFEVEALLDLRDSPTGQELLVSWRGFPESMNTWEPLETIREDLPGMVEEFLSNRSA